jgi:hypothetical protein
MSADLAFQKRKEAIDPDVQPLRTSERTINEQTDDCFYCNVPARVAHRMDIDAGSTVKIDEYRNKLVIRTEPNAED